MHFWNIESLKEDIKNKSLSERNKLRYMLFYSVLFIVSVELRIGIQIKENIWDQVNLLLGYFITLTGILACYRANNGNQGRDFLARYLSVGFVMIFRIAPLLAICVIFSIIYYFYMISNDLSQTNALDVAVYNICYAIYYWRIYSHISDLNNR